jgi:hypothetical protein
MDDITAARPCGSWEDLCLFLDGSPTSFTGMLLTLIAKADPGNRARLRAEFPRHVAAWETWVGLAPCTWGELDAATAAVAERRTVTFDVSGADEFHVITQALEDYAGKAAVMASREDASESFARWAAIADRMKAQAEAAAG